MREGKDREHKEHRDPKEARDNRDFKESKEKEQALDRRRVRGGDKKRRTRRKVCRFCEDGNFYVDYKNYRRLREYISDRGKMLPRRMTGTCAKHQRMLKIAIEQARFIALLSYIHR